MTVHKTAFFVISAIVIAGLWFYFKRNRKPETLDAATRFAGSSTNTMKQLNTQLRQQSQQQIAQPDDDDLLFYPAPAVTERVQSTQWTHMQEQELFFKLDYQQKYGFSLVLPQEETVSAYKQATRDQIISVREHMRVWFGQDTHDMGITATTFDDVFKGLLDKNELFIKQWQESQVQLDLLQSYQKELADESFDAFSRFMAEYGYVVTPTGTISEGGAVKPTPIQAPVNFGDKQPLTMRGDGLSMIPRNRATPVSGFSSDQIRHLADQYVDRTYDQLLDRYKYIISDIPASTFRGEREKIRDTGKDLFDQYLDPDTVTKYQIDEFCAEVDDSMKETLFDILLHAGVDVTQFE